MKLYTKGERRYTEAPNSAVLGAASVILRKMGLANLGHHVGGIGDGLFAMEQNPVLGEALRAEEKKED